MAQDRFHAPEDSAEYEELFDAATNGDIERLEAALLPSMNVNALEADHAYGRAALHIAADWGNVTAIHFLLAHGANVNLRDSDGETPLHWAAFSARLDAIRALIDAGADINLQAPDYGFTALHNVLKHKNAVTPLQIQTIELLLDRGLDLNADTESWGSAIAASTTLGQACRLESFELAQILVDRGAHLDNALVSASNDAGITKLLLGRGAEVVSAPGQTSALTNAAGRGNIEVVRLLLSHATDAELASSREALHWAAAGGRRDVVKLLIEHGFDVNTTINDCMVGATPLLATCETEKPNPERLAVAKLLIDSRADVNALSRDGKTAAELLFHREHPQNPTELALQALDENQNC
ncbi:MAG: hypothetical protein LQ338_008254 [Usnochroma carphineum]|nr:MAG: hypothetical protein LQ338_008254 [Usnochroma carphineum]